MTGRVTDVEYYERLESKYKFDHFNFDKYDLIPYDKELNETAAKRKATRTKKRKDLGEDSEKSNSKLEQIEIPDIPDEDPDDEGDD